MTAFWRRLDVAGHDSCLLRRGREGWALHGCAVFAVEAGGGAAIQYRVLLDQQWRFLSATLTGHMDGKPVRHGIGLETGTWMLNGSPVPGLEGLVDLDLGFTPATNLAHLRRLAPDIGERTDCPVAWFDLEEASLTRLDQSYRPLTETTAAYEAPRFDYAATLVLGEDGFIEEYPGLWQRLR